MTPDKDYLIKLGKVGRGEIIKGKCQGRDCEKDGQERIEGGLLCGCWCDECFAAMVAECRSRSW